MKKKILIILGAILIIGLLGWVLPSWYHFIYNDCKLVGHTDTYCFWKALGGKL